jgi:hypothetical protein
MEYNNKDLEFMNMDYDFGIAETVDTGALKPAAQPRATLGEQNSMAQSMTARNNNTDNANAVSTPPAFEPQPPQADSDASFHSTMATNENAEEENAVSLKPTAQPLTSQPNPSGPVPTTTGQNNNTEEENQQVAATIMEGEEEKTDEADEDDKAEGKDEAA